MSQDSSLTEPPPDRWAEIGVLPEACALREELIRELRWFQEAAHDYPLESPIQRMALEISHRLEQRTITLKDIEDLIQILTLNAFVFRAERLKAYVGETRPDANREGLAALIRRLADGPEGERLSFDVFRSRLEREVVGLVITAHPTFGCTVELTRQLARLASGFGADGRSLDEESRASLFREAARQRHEPDPDISLAYEHAFAEEAIVNIQHALRQVYEVVLEVACALYPERWPELTPRLVTIASWVGYDLDGRGDISWTDTLGARMRAESRQLERYVQRLDDLIETTTEEGHVASAVATPLREAGTRLRQHLALLKEELALLPVRGDDPDAVAPFARRLTADRGNRLVDVAEVVTRLEAALANASDVTALRELAMLKAEMANYGLGLAHIHVRLNATQLNNAIRKQVGLESAPDDPSSRRRYVNTLNQLLDVVRPETINFGSVLNEQASAKRMMMVVAQILKYVDAATSIRFLIAECDTAFTVLSALYLARLFGVEDKIDISPLFETPEALRNGHEILSSLLENQHYRDYARKRGRICIQTGFSDAGRYIGQVAASLAVERVRMKIAELIARHGLDGVELVIFDTHGESIGRGAHPLSFSDRLDYIYPPAARARLARTGALVKQEVSFQGGDGYVFFSTPELALATVCRIVEHALAKPAEADEGGERSPADDLFYEDTDYSLEFFITAKAYNEALMDNPDYAALLHAFGPSLLYATGSRKPKRQHDTKASVEQSHPSQLRAIPHNAILQQMGFLANSICGIGKAIGRDRDYFAHAYRRSDRCRKFTSLVAYAHNVSSLDAFGAYLTLFDPVAWLRRAQVARDPQRRDNMRRLARLLQETGRHERLNRIHRLFMQESMDLTAGLDAIRDAGMLPPFARRRHPDLELLHAVRAALIQEMFLLVTRIPRFSTEPGVTIDDVVTELLHLDVDRAVPLLRKAFPITAEDFDDEAFGEPASYKSDAEMGYGPLHRELFDPLLEIHGLVRRVSAGVSHIMGAVG